MYDAVNVTASRGSQSILPAALVALGLLLQGCGERQETPVGPPSPGGTDEAALSADKEHNAVDLGPPAASARIGGAHVVSAFATTSSIPFDPEPGPFAHSAALFCDDCVLLGLPIGFSFTFFGNTFTHFNASANGFIGFSPPVTTHGCCSGRPIPSADELNNIIAAAWTDLYPGGGGDVRYETRGRAPNRYLVVAYENVPWCCGPGAHVSSQIILYEGTNAIEIHTANQSAGHIYTQGVENENGTLAAFQQGRVAANYGLTNDGVRFTTVLGSWTGRTSLPSARLTPAVGTANGLVYVIGGLNSAGSALSSVAAYNPGTNAWTTKASMPAARQGGNGAVAIGSTMYVAGGFDAARALTRTLYAYNVNTNTWSTRASMPALSSCGGSAVISGKLYVFSGCTRSSTGAQVAAGLLHRYDPATNRWTTLRSAPSVHFSPAVRAVNGKLYVAGGNDGASVAMGRLDVYDPATNTWSTRAAMPTARVAAAAAGVGGKLYVLGGRNAGASLNKVEAYDPVTNRWSIRASMPTARSGLGVGVINDLVYAVAGRRNSSTIVATNERFTP